MTNKTRLQIAKPDIVKTFIEQDRVFRTKHIADILKKNRDYWRLAKSTTLHRFIEFLVDKTELRPIQFSFPHREVSGYTWGTVPLMETLIKLVEHSFYSHYTALRIHGLTEQIPKTIYLNLEKSKSSVIAHSNIVVYEQEAIDRVFKGHPRTTTNIIELPEEKCRVALLQSAYHEGAGIISGTFHDGSQTGIPIRYTDLERTMIDIAIRPFYAGGVAEVAKAFDNAKDSLSVNKMSAMLKKMKFGYPYHQVIGYYLERSGYKSTLVDIFRRQPIVYDFYLTHGLERTTYCEKWCLYIPEGF